MDTLDNNLDEAEARLQRELAEIRRKKQELADQKWQRENEERLARQKAEIAEQEKKREEIEKAKNTYNVSTVMHNGKSVIGISTVQYCHAYHYLMQIPEAGWNAAHQRYHIPMAYGYKVAEVLAKQESERNASVTWGELTRKECLRQLELRGKIDALAMAEDTEYTGHTSLELRPFQKVAAAFSEATDDVMLGVMDVGLGKTLVALERAMAKNYRTLIVVKAALVANWVKQVKKITGQNCVVFKGLTPTPHDIKTIIAHPAQFHIISMESLRRVTTQTEEKGTFKVQTDRYLWAEAIKCGLYQLLIVDEVQSICNMESSQSKSVRELATIPHRIALSATPMKSKQEELFPVLNLLRPQEFASYAEFSRLIYNTQAIQKALAPVMFRRRKSQVLKDLPAMERITREVEMSEKAMKLYRKAEAGLEGILDADGGFIPTKEIMAALAILNKCRMITSLSKMDASADLAIELYDSAKENNHPKQKVIIFSYYKSCVYGIAKRLGHEAICFTGDDKKNGSGYMEYVEEFQSNPDKHFLVMQLMTGGEGFDITEADSVIFNDFWWTPVAHEQAEGRCYGRMNDLHGATSYWMTCPETIDEDMQDILSSKLALIAATIDGADAIRNTSIVQDVIGRLKRRK